MVVKTIVGEAVPGLRGVLSTREADLDAAARDFGNRVRRRPLAVLRPADAGDVAAVVRFGREHGITVVPRGAGHAVDGQAQARDGIVVDLSSLDGVGEAGPDAVTVDAGARWDAVADAVLPAGLTPIVLPDHLGLTVGGTLSAGGFGGTSHRHGCVADTVRDLEVVTRSGERVTCSPTGNAALFDAVRGTQGEHGIVTRATLALTRAPGAARRHLLPYRDLGTFLADQRRLIEDGRFHHVEGQARPAGDGEGAGWVFVLEAMAAFDPPHEPDDRALLAGLSHRRGAEETETTGYGDFLRRAAPLEARLRDTGSWQDDPHPRCNVLLPGRHAEDVIAATLAGLTAADIGPGGGVLLYPVPTERILAPHAPKAAGDAVTVLFGLQRTAPRGDPDALERMLRGNEALREAAAAVGGVRYTAPTAFHEARATSGTRPTT
ncbi:FAD-binding protein [Streptomyces triculaminicus]|uniref:FAD-binding protein n=1 Tax=Streptomyces triculaminicus TaxID=2816232 RepID=A0A939JNP0_9ACTN|nr:FAD-binding protein [Streptomyces triculaminicus]MBO0655511.1 FAD-binding protein [Streptomyces triculaminicus]